MLDKRVIAGVGIALAMLVVGCEEKKGEPKPGDKPADKPVAPANGTPTAPVDAPKTGGEPPKTTTTADGIVGIWVLDKDATIKNALEMVKKMAPPDQVTPEKLKEAEAAMRAQIPDIEIVFKADGTGSMKAGGESKTGKWKKEGGSYVIAPDDKPDDSAKFKLEGDTLRPDAPADSQEAALVLKRK